MSKTIHIAVDAMGGDFGPRLCVPASQKFLKNRPDVRITLVGDKNLISAHLSASLPEVDVTHTDVVVEMDDKPANALRRKSESSMAHALQLLSTGEVCASVSAGNTGALMAFGIRSVGMIEGIDRPAICKALPSAGGLCWVLDLGASLECTAVQLLQYAKMAKVVVEQMGITQPRVGLLNVGVEAQKGRVLQREAAALLSRGLQENYIGFVEGGDVFRGVADIVVCDGFTGNVLLKASQGASELLQNSLSERFNQSVASRLIAQLVRPILQSWQRDYHVSRFNGAMFLGLSKVLVKSHGVAGEEGFCSALQEAYDQVKNRTIEKIHEGLLSQA